jgi:hypothetical protein
MPSRAPVAGHRWTAAAAIAACTVGLLYGGGLLYLVFQSKETRAKVGGMMTELAKSQAPGPEYSFVLSPHVDTRAESEIANLRRPEGVDTVRLQFRLLDAPREVSYTVTIQAGGVEVWSRTGLQPDASGVINVTVPVLSLTPGERQAILTANQTRLTYNFRLLPR